jgi:hypothetical protein
MRSLATIPAFFLCTLAAASPALAQSSDLQMSENAIVYGQDNRRDLYEYSEEPFATIARESVVTLMYRSSLDATNPNSFGFFAPTLGDSQGLCDGERFATQPVPGFCSGTLIGPDLVLTAGHCVNDFSCPRISTVFNFSQQSANQLRPVPIADVFNCARVVARVENDSLDYAVIQLDRPATPRFTPATVRTGPLGLGEGAPLVMIGSPSGLPIKIDDGGRIRDPDDGNFFIATTDSFGGNSGSGVFDAQTGDLVGILTSGDVDYVRDGRCFRVNVCGEDECGGENSVRASIAISGFCSAATDEELCGSRSVCGDGFCAFDERDTCSDCAAPSCGDGVCNVNEWGTCDDCVSPIPEGWDCEPSYFGTGDGCDCDCGTVEDPDCDDPDQERINCDEALCSATSRGPRAHAPVDRYNHGFFWIAAALGVWSISRRRAIAA